MDNTTESLLLKILDICGYEGDKKAFVDEFISNIQFEALLNIVNNSPEKKEEWLRALNKMEKPEQVSEFISDNIPTDEYADELEKVSEKAMTEYLKAIEGSLTENQKQQIADLQN